MCLIHLRWYASQPNLQLNQTCIKRPECRSPGRRELMKHAEMRLLYQSEGTTRNEYLALKLVDGSGQLHLRGFRKLRVQTAAHLLLPFLLVLVLGSREGLTVSSGPDSQVWTEISGAVSFIYNSKMN